MVDELPGLWVLEALSRGGVDIPTLRGQIPREVDEVLRAPDEIHPDLVNRLLIACAENSGDENFGLHMTSLIPLEAYGTYGFLLLNAPTVGVMLELAERYYPVFYRGCRVAVSSRGGVVRVTYESLDEQTVSPRHDDEWTLGFFVDRVRLAVGPEWQPTRVSFRHPKPDDTAELEEWFGSNARWGRRYCWFEFEDDVLDCPYDAADDGILALVVEQAQGSLEAVLAAGSFVAEARLHLTELMTAGEANAEALARRLSVSVSTLKRRLADEGVTFRRLRDDVVMAFATDVLVRTDVHVGTIARRAGYSDLSAFDRAFRRVMECSPSEYRSQHRSPGPGPT